MFNLRLLTGLFIVLAGAFLVLAGLGAFSVLTGSVAQAQQKNMIITRSPDPRVPNGFDCSKIHELGIDKQMNFRAGAIMIACGEAQGGGTPAIPPASPQGALTQFVKKLFSPLAYGGTDVDLVTGTETFPNVIQSTTFSWGNPDNPDQIVVAYFDSRGAHANPINGSGASVSTDGGLTFTRLTAANGQSPFPNTGGDPVVIYNRPTGTWYTVLQDAACGYGLGGYKSTTPWDPSPASWTHYGCVHSSSGGSDERASGWSDMNPSSPFYGRMYVSWGDFGRGGNIFVRYSTDNGLTWTNERQVTTTFIRNVQITGDLVTGDVYLAGMDENGGNGCTSGCGSNRNNKIYRSTDGGNSWTNTYTGPAFVGACRSAVGYFCGMYSSPVAGYWRYMGGGEPAANNHVVHYVYAARNPGTGDPGDVFYIRSTDSGTTFSAPFQLNSNTDPAKAQWMPSLSVSPSGTLFAVWYDERDGEGASTCIAGSNSPCYRMYARRSNDNGLTWLPDDAFSDVVSPLPGQPDPGILPTYVSDYDYASAVATRHLASWVDGRVPINGTYQSDAFTDRELVNTTPTPPCTDDTWTPTSTTNAPDGRMLPTAVWTGSEMIVWGGTTDRINGLNTGGRYNPSTDSWTPTSTINAPTARFTHTAVWTGSEMIVWGGYNNSNRVNTGGRYDPSTDTWTATNTTNAPDARFEHTAVWTGSEMIVWGGLGDTGDLNTGGRYNPTTDTWIATNSANAPTSRRLNTVVWTGTEMIAWAGVNNVTNLNTGGRYNPNTDNWTATSIANAPTGRTWHTAVWTGSKMIVWGGYGGGSLNTGGQYDPSTDSWTATSTSGAPSARDAHTAVWSGSEMIVWGGENLATSYDTGGRYDPGTDAWTATNTSGAPAARYWHTAVWTGSQMIVWGGYNHMSVFNTGGKYCAQSSAPTPTPTPTPTATATATATPTATATATHTPTATPTATVTATVTPTATPTATPTSTPTPTPAPRGSPTPRPRPTPLPRP